MESKNNKKLTVMDDFFYFQMKEMFEVRKAEKTVGERYFIRNKRKAGENLHKLKGTVERYCIDKKYEIVIFKSEGELDQRLMNPKISLNIIRILYCTAGECSITVHYSEKDKPEETFRLDKGKIIIQKMSNEIERYEFVGTDFEYMTIEFYWDMLISELERTVNEYTINKWKNSFFSELKNGIFYKSNRNREFILLTEEIKKISSLKNISSYLRIKSKVFQLLLLMIDSQNEFIRIQSNYGFDTVLKCKELIDSYHISKIPLVKELCDILKISKYQLSSSFKLKEGIGIAEYIQRKKMSYAKNLLETTHKDINEIAVEVGYKNPSKFSVIFKKCFNILPNKYRKINYKK